jgi:hypothetical protein
MTLLVWLETLVCLLAVALALAAALLRWMRP